MTLRGIFFDLETTGLKPERDRIIEIAAWDPVNNRQFSSLVHPQMSIPDESRQITGITDEMVQNAPTFDKVAPEFISFCEGSVAMIAHNGDAFDKPFLQAELERVGLSIPEHWVWIDTLKWSRKYRPDLPRHSLQHLREIHGIAANNAHRALDDVIILSQIFSMMIDDLPLEKVRELLGEKEAIDKMPFGKFKGRPLKDVPPSYVSWLLQSGALDKPESQSLKSQFIELGLLKT